MTSTPLPLWSLQTQSTSFQRYENRSSGCDVIRLGVVVADLVHPALVDFVDVVNRFRYSIRYFLCDVGRFEALNLLSGRHEEIESPGGNYHTQDKSCDM